MTPSIHTFRAPESVMAKPYAYRSDRLIPDVYFRLLLLVAPIQSILLTPVQGSTPAFLLVLGSLGLLFGTDQRYVRLAMFFGGFVALYVLYLALGLSAYLIDEPDLSRLTVIREAYLFGHLKQTHVTQGLYLLAALSFWFLIYTYFQEAFVKYAYYGILLLALYGFYEFTYYALFHSNGDFLSNRNFGDLDTAAAGAGQGAFATGSALQGSNVFGPNFMRLKSLVGEPSMYALTVTPFAVYAYSRRWWLIFGILTLSLILSTSSTGLLGMMIGLSYVHVRRQKDFILYICAAIISFTLLYYTATPFQEAVDKLLFQKLDTLSGTQRLTSFVNHVGIAFDGNPIRMLFGLGFGTVRATDMFSNLLANVGILGLLAYSAGLVAPCFLLKRSTDREAIVAAILSVYVMEMATVSEYAYLPPWFMVALGYARARKERCARVAERHMA